jgi:hypothetical protein
MKVMDVILHTSAEPEPLGRMIFDGTAAARLVIRGSAQVA